eukprot:UC1_evm3s1006
MSMAQQRDKQKRTWSRDPRNTFWERDDGKFGQRMMEKLGWKKGDGLGVGGKGRTTHVAARRKNNLFGLGAQAGGDNDFNWLKTQDLYASALAELNNDLAAIGGGTGSGDCSANTSPTKSQSSSSKARQPRSQRSKLLYSRFKRAKDLSTYSADDLGCILGQAEYRPERHVKKSQEEGGGGEVGGLSEVEPEQDSDTGVKTITRTESVTDYFKARLAAKGLSKVGRGPQKPPFSPSSSSLSASSNFNAAGAAAEAELAAEVRAGLGSSSSNSGTHVRDSQGGGGPSNGSGSGSGSTAADDEAALRKKVRKKLLKRLGREPTEAELEAKTAKKRKRRRRQEGEEEEEEEDASSIAVTVHGGGGGGGGGGGDGDGGKKSKKQRSKVVVGETIAKEEKETHTQAAAAAAAAAAVVVAAKKASKKAKRSKKKKKTKS